MKNGMAVKAIGDISHKLVMQLYHFPDKDLIGKKKVYKVHQQFQHDSNIKQYAKGLACS